MTAETRTLHRNEIISLTVSFGLSTLIFAVAGNGAPIAAVPVAACAGVVIGLGNRLWSFVTGCALLGWAFSHGFTIFDPVSLAISIILLSASVLPLPLPRLPWIGYAALPLGASVATSVAIHGRYGIITIFMTLAASGTAGLASLMVGRMIAAGGLAGLPAKAALPRELSSIARHLLMGRVAGGAIHDLSQSLNVIMMANGNLSYIIDRLDISPSEREQLMTRIQRISAHSDLVTERLSLLRWFGRNGSRDHAIMSVGNALRRAIAATHLEARTAGMTIELRGDALDYPALVRHGNVEMIGVAALLDLFGSLSGHVEDDIDGLAVLDASHKGDDIIISLLCEQLPSGRGERSDIDRATFDLANGFAQECGGGFVRVSRRNDPVQLAIRLNRGAL